jgi:hypothetical protein
MSEPTRDPALTALETALAALAPLPADISRDGMLFRAGQASVRHRRVWPCATAALALLSVALGAVLLSRPVPRTVERIVYVRVPVPAPAPAAAAPVPPREEPSPAVAADADEAPPDPGYLRLRRQAEEHGADALPPAAAWPTPSRPASLDSLLGLPPDTLAAPQRLRARTALSPGGAS